MWSLTCPKLSILTPAKVLLFVLADAEKLAKIPGIIVQGRYDMVCPLVSAYELQRAWPQAEFRIVPDAGHSAWEPGILGALVDATQQFKHTPSYTG